MSLSNEQSISTAGWKSDGKRTETDNAPPSGPPFLSLPSELIHHILTFLPVLSLAPVLQTCKCLRHHAMDDLLWESWVNSIGSFKIHQHAPYESFQSLYIAHHRYWFLVRDKIWFSDSPHTGKLLIARYDHRLGSIEAYRVVVSQGPRNFIAWPENPEVMIHTFDPHVRLWLEDPVIQLAKPQASSQGHHARHEQWRGGEIPMHTREHTQGVFNTFLLCPKATYPETEGGTYEEVEPDRRAELWPPPTIPSEHHIDRYPPKHYLWDQKQLSRSAVCETGFRTRRWVQFRSFLPVFDEGSANGVGESMETFSTLRPELYTPTKEKPYQGIWVGDYSGNGCEFLLFMQRDDAPAAEGDAPVVEDVDSLGLNYRRNSSSYAASPSSSSPPFSDADSTTPERQKQRLEAIKLTGDPNVPRGEISFRTDDVGVGNTRRVSQDDIFKGARIVPAQGHIASRNFQNGRVSPLLLLFSCLEKRK